MTDGGTTDTKTRILDTAERLVQTRGYNASSYADVAVELDLTKASLHYHFAGKAELGEALITRYTANFSGALAVIEAASPDAPARLAAYADLYADVLRGNRMCLCGVLAGEYDTLPEPMRHAIIHFFDVNTAWLARVLEDGAAAGTMHLHSPAIETAQLILDGLEGAMLVARPYHDLARFQRSARHLIGALTSTR